MSSLSIDNYESNYIMDSNNKKHLVLILNTHVLKLNP